MRQLNSVLVLSAIVAAALAVQPAQALPLGPMSASAVAGAQSDPAAPVIQVRNGGAVAAGIVGGMILGGIIASQARPYYYDYPPAYYYYPEPYPVYPAYPYAPSTSYCARRYRSYDPYSMTYLGYDGLRHPCP